MKLSEPIAPGSKGSLSQSNVAHLGEGAAAIRVESVRKSYGQTEALKGVDLEVRRGELFGLIGPDGAGKTTLIRTICGLLIPDAGRVEILGRDVHAGGRGIREVLGYMPQHFSLYPDLSVEQNLRFFAELYRVPPDVVGERLEELYRFSRLRPFRDRKSAALSGGMKQKLALSCALINRPAVLVLDEPTYGVDPISRHELWQILQSIRASGTTILVSTAYMEEADLCDRVAFLHKGYVVRQGTPGELKSAYPYSLYRIRCRDKLRGRKFFQKLEQTVDVHAFGDALHVSFATDPGPEDWQRWKEQSGGILESWRPVQPSIEDVFLHEMGDGVGERGHATGLDPKAEQGR